MTSGLYRGLLICVVIIVAALLGRCSRCSQSDPEPVEVPNENSAHISELETSVVDDTQLSEELSHDGQQQSTVSISDSQSDPGLTITPVTEQSAQAEPDAQSDVETLEGNSETPLPPSESTVSKRIEFRDLEERDDFFVEVASGKRFSGEAYNLFEDGELEFVGRYQDGLKHGSHQNWYADGAMRYECHYQNGLRHGVRTLWNVDGQVRWQEKYENGIRVR